MEHIFKDLNTDRKWAWGCLILAFVLVAILVLSSKLTRSGQGWLSIAAYLSLVLFFWPSILKACCSSHKHLMTVVVWSFVLVVLGMSTCFFAFFMIAGDDSTKFDKILNVVPVFVAIWAAAVGWLIHFKLSTKAHRTNNAFSIIMETRKSSEYLQRAELASRHFPPGTRAIPATYDPYFAATSLSDLKARGATAVEVGKAEAILALKYVLNYYEFMAVGIRVGDLDEDLVFDTISTTVVAYFERAQRLVEYLSNPDNPGGHELSYCELKPLIADWKVRQKVKAATMS